MQATGVVLLSLLAVVFGSFLARATRAPAPLVQIALGAAIALSGLVPLVLDPEVFFLLFLPPLLFLDGWRIPKDALLRDAPSILRLALGLVVATVLGMGWFIHWLIPAMPLAVAFALAAVISPTDPIAVAAIAARTPLPKRLMHILQGESLLNDASGLVCMRFAVAAALTGTFSLTSALASFVWVALGGLAIGALVTWGVARAAAWEAQRFGTDGGAQILVTLLIPFGVYLLAEQLHCSGILAAVAAGVTMGFTDVWQWSPATRLQRTAVWDTVQLVANGSIFVLLGGQIPALVQAAPQTVLGTAHQDAWWLLVYVVLILAMLAALRFAWVWVSLRVTLAGHGRGDRPAAAAPWRLVMVASLAGVRGAVTLAGVLTLPVLLADGSPFPARDLAIVLAAGVIVLSLVTASIVLPHVLRGLEMPPEPPPHAAEEQTRAAAVRAAIEAVETAARSLADDGVDPRRSAAAAARVVARYRQRIARPGGDIAARRRGETEDLERRLQLVGLRAERDEIQRLARSGEIEELVRRRLVRDLDLQEARYGG